MNKINSLEINYNLRAKAFFLPTLPKNMSFWQILLILVLLSIINCKVWSMPLFIQP